MRALQELAGKLLHRNNESELARLREEVGVIFRHEVKVREAICARNNLIPGRIKILKAGGTIFSKTDDHSVRTGKSRDPSTTINNHFPTYKQFIDKDEEPIYDGVSEDLYSEELDKIEIKVAKAINNSPRINNFIMFVGSDMTEVIARKLQAGMAEELSEHGIKLLLVWANEPIPDSSALSQIETALDSTKNFTLKGGVYIVSKQKLIKAENAHKATWDNEPMYYFDATDEMEMEKERTRRLKNRELAVKLSFKLCNKSLDQLVEEMDPDRYKHAWRYIVALSMLHEKANVDKVTVKRKTRKKDKKAWLSNHLTTDPVDHPIDKSKAVAIKHVNLSTKLQTPKELYDELKDTKAVIFVMNHSLTTSAGMAHMITEVCNRRIVDGNPLAAFCVTETGERRSFNPQTGIYPSAALLRYHVIPIPGPLIPNFVKLYASVHQPDFEVTPELTDFMLKRIEGNDDLSGEISESLVYQPDVRLVKQTMFYGNNLWKVDPHVFD